MLGLALRANTECVIGVRESGPIKGLLPAGAIQPELLDRCIEMSRRNPESETIKR
jgi:hypothetical protein